MRLAVVGSRDLPASALGYIRHEVMRVGHVHGWDVVIVSGGARGADALAEEVARTFDLPTEIYRADWKRHGKRAGFLRNQQIVDRADQLLAFWHYTRTPGTLDTVNRALVKGIPVATFLDGLPVSAG